MIASGALSPLTGFMTKADYDRLGRGHAPRERPALGDARHAVGRRSARRATGSRSRAHEGDLLAVLDVEEVFEADRENEAAKVFRTDRGGPSRRRPDLRRGPDPGRRPGDRVQAAGAGLPGSPPRSRRTRGPRSRSVAGAGSSASRPATRCTGRTSTSRSARWRPSTACCCTRWSARPRATTCPPTCAMRCYEVLLDGYYPADRTHARARSRPRCATPGRARPSGTRSAARTTAARTSSSAATTRAWAATTAPTTRT